MSHAAPEEETLRTRLLAALSIIAAAACFTPVALATHTPYLDSVTATTSGCQPKGVWAAPFDHPAGALTPGAYRYAVGALNAAGAELAPSCEPSVTVIGVGNSDASLLAWLATPGATQYRVYRGSYVEPPGTSPPMDAVVTVSAASVGCANGGRCFFTDPSASTVGGGAPTLATTSTQAGSPVDLELTQRIDYGGTDPNSSPTDTSDDPFPAALKTDLLHFPAGLVPNMGATRDATGALTRCALTGPNSLLGDPQRFGGDDPNEDTCPRRTLLGTVRAISRTSQGLFSYPGEVYNGTPKGTEAGRLYMVLRPRCSIGFHPELAPGSSTCRSALGQTGGETKNREVEKLYLAVQANFVDRDNGAIALDANAVKAEDDGPLPPTTNVLVADPGTGELLRAATRPEQLRQVRQDLVGLADQGTLDKADDAPFVVFPTSCVVKTLTAEVSTHEDPTPASSTRNLTATGCDLVPFGPTIEGRIGGSGQNAKEAAPVMTVTIRQQPDDAALKSITLNLPPSVGRHLPGLQAQCSPEQFASNTCLDAAKKGEASATSALLPFPLTGPVYLLANGNDLPRLAVKLVGGPLKLQLLGDIDLGPNGLITSFPSVPEVTLSSLTLSFSGGPAGLVSNVVDLCAGAGNIAGSFEGHNGKSAAASAALVVDQAGCPSTTVKPVPIPVSTARVTKIRQGKPSVSLTVDGGLSQTLESLRISMPKGLKISKRGLKKGLKVTVNGKARKQFFLAKGRLSLNGLPVNTTRIAVSFAKGAILASKQVAKQGKRRTLTFTMLLVDTQGRSFTLTPRAKPRS